jgi:UDP-2,3-diacylglucosamine hydrolase
MSHALPPLPRFWEVPADPSWQAIDFISDLHLAQNSPLTFDAFSRHLLNTPADAVFILGDLFDAWVGDDARHEGFEAGCAEVLAEAASRRAVAFMAGNRDFLLGADMLSHCGMLALADPSVLMAFGQRLMLCHGDALCLSDLPYQAFRAEVRSFEWQGRFLALPLAKRREVAGHLRAESQRRHADTMAEDAADIDTPTAVAWMHEAGTPVMIHGHTHHPGSEPLAPGFVRHVLSDWDLDGHHGPARGEVLRLTGRGISRLGLSQALLPLSAAAPPTHPHRS